MPSTRTNLGRNSGALCMLLLLVLVASLGGHGADAAADASASASLAEREQKMKLRHRSSTQDESEAAEPSSSLPSLDVNAELTDRELSSSSSSSFSPSLSLRGGTSPEESHEMDYTAVDIMHGSDQQQRALQTGGGVRYVLNAGAQVRSVKQGVAFDVENTSSKSIVMDGFDINTITNYAVGFKIYYKSGSWNGNLGSASAWTAIGCGTLPEGSTLKSTPSGSVKGVTISPRGGTVAFFIALDSAKLGLSRGIPNNVAGPSDSNLVLYGGPGINADSLSANVNDWTNNLLFQGRINYSLGGTGGGGGGPSCLARMGTFYSAASVPPCDITTEVSCSGPGGYDCNAISPSATVSTCPPSAITFTYIGTDCWGSTAPGYERIGSLCTYGDNVLVEKAAKLTVKVDDKYGGGRAQLYQRTISLGETFKVTAELAAPYKGKMLGPIRILIIMPDQRLSQIVNLPTDQSKIQIGKIYGAFRVDSFESDCQGVVPPPYPLATLTYKYKISNDGSEPIAITSTDAIQHGSWISSPFASGMVIQNGKSLVVTKSVSIDLRQKSSSKIDTSLQIGAKSTSSGRTCQDSDSYGFRAPS